MADLDLLRSLGTVKQFPKNQTVFMQNDSGSCMYIVLKGVFGVYINSLTDFPVRVAGIGQGSFFGEMSVIDGWPRSATIVSEDAGAAIAIEKDNFGTLLEKAPDIAGNILETLRNRALSTAETCRSAGKEAPSLPPLLSAIQFRDAKSSLTFMTMLAQKVRQMNDLLVGASEPAVPPQSITISPDTVKLLPDGYVRFDINDDDNNREKLRLIRVTCPYCGLESDAYIPVFSYLAGSPATLDGRVVYANLDILRYTNVICPNCNYADTYMEFSKPGAPSEPPRYTGNQFKNAEGFTGYAKKQNNTVDEAILSYYLNIACLTRTSTDPLRFAKAWIRLYWLYSDQKCAALAKRAAKRARHFYARHLEHNADAMTDDDRMRLNAILGEMSVALGEYDQAMLYYAHNGEIGKNSKNDLARESKKRYEEIKRM